MEDKFKNEINGLIKALNIVGNLYNENINGSKSLIESCEETQTAILAGIGEKYLKSLGNENITIHVDKLGYIPVNQIKPIE